MDEQVLRIGETVSHEKFYAAPHRGSSLQTTIGIDLGDVWSHYCTLNEDGEVVDRGRFRTSPTAVEKCLPIYRQRGWRWKPGSIRSGSASSFRSWAMKSFVPTSVSCGRSRIVTGRAISSMPSIARATGPPNDEGQSSCSNFTSSVA
jgi:hypothetical protein